MRYWKIAAAVVAGLALSAAGAHAANGKPSLKAALAQLKVPPAWFNTTKIQWDTNRPWKDARLEVRRLMALGAEENRQAVKITYLYSQKGDIGNGHELPMYLFMSGNYAWAAQEFPKHIQSVAGQGPTHIYLCYVSTLAHFGEYGHALQVLQKASQDLQAAPWRIFALANVENAYGDLYAEMGDMAKAKQHYAEAIRLYPTSNQPYGRHLLVRYAAKVQSKLDLLTMQSLKPGQLRDGTYSGRSLGYADTKDMVTTVTVKGGRIADIKVQHQEKIELGATTSIPQRIIAKQSLKVDAVTGATVTSQAIVEGTFQALKQAGLK